MEQQNSPIPMLYTLVGYPGAGKTFFARQLAEKEKIVHLQADELVHIMYPSPTYSDEELEAATRLMDYMAASFLGRGISVIYDGRANRRADRQRLRELARKHKARTMVIWVQTDMDTSLERAIERDRRRNDDKFARPMNTELFARLQREMVRPEHEDYVVISGKHVFVNQYRVFANKRNQLVKNGTAGPQGQGSTRPALGGRVDMQRRRNYIR